MKKTFKFLLILLAFMSPFSSASSSEELNPDPSAIMRATQPTSGARGIILQENMEALYSIGFIRFTKNELTKSDGSAVLGSDVDWGICATWSDSNCKPRSGSTVEGYVVFGNCINDSELGCVESLNKFGSDGKETELKFLGLTSSSVVDIPQADELAIPRSTSRPIFQDEKGNLFIVRASLLAHYDASNFKLPVFNLSVDITPVIKISESDISAPEAVRLPNNVSGLGVVTVRPTRDDCVAIGAGYCYKAIKADTTIPLTLKLRVPNGVSGWMNGRFSEPSFAIKQLNAKSQLISVTAKPSAMPIAGGWVNYADLPANFLESVSPGAFSNKNPEAAYYLVTSPSQGDNGFKTYGAWAPYLKDRALTTLTTWSFATSIKSTEQFCLSSGNDIAGVVSSNASVYSSRPPTWDPANSTLSYQVASPHNDENGKENVGTYTLAMSIKTIQCLYGQSTLPPSATISIGYGAEVATVSTVTLKSVSGWVYFNASGFHYSNPTIKVKFAKSASQPAVPTPSKNSTLNSSAPPVSETAPGIKTQWCAKGNAKKKVTGPNPVCPKGYKKIAEPLTR